MVTAITAMPNGLPAIPGFDQRGSPTEVLVLFNCKKSRKPIEMKQILHLRMDSSRFYSVMPNKSDVSL